MYILAEYQNNWNYTFVIVAIIAIIIGSILEYRHAKKQQLKRRRDKRR